MHGPWKSFLVVMLLFPALLVSVACEGATRAQIEGILQNVDSISGEVTVTLKDGGTVTFNLKDVNVETLRQATGSASLDAGTQVTLETDKDKKIKKVKARQAEVEGIIKGLDAVKKTLTVSSGEDGETTLELTETTKIEIEDEEAATFDSLREGQNVEVKYDVETKKALKIEVEEEEGEEDDDDFEGTVTAVNQDAKTVTIRAKNGTETVYKVTASTKLELDGVATFDGLKVGMKVEAKVNDAINELTKLELKD